MAWTPAVIVPDHNVRYWHKADIWWPCQKGLPTCPVMNAKRMLAPTSKAKRAIAAICMTFRFCISVPPITDLLINKD